MTLTSNLEGVVLRIRARQRDIPAAMAATLNPEAWREAMALTAGQTLWALAGPDEWKHVEPFLKAVLTGKLADGFFSAMNNPLPPAMGIEDFAIVNHMQLKGTATGTGPGLFSDLMNQFDQLMTDWVATEKDKDARDWDKSDEDIGSWIGHLMLTPDANLSAKERTAKKSLMPHIVDYISRRQTAARLPDATINAWLRAVLAAWRAQVRREFPARLEANLKKLGETIL